MRISVAIILFINFGLQIPQNQLLVFNFALGFCSTAPPTTGWFLCDFALGLRSTMGLWLGSATLSPIPVSRLPKMSIFCLTTYRLLTSYFIGIPSSTVLSDAFFDILALILSIVGAGIFEMSDRFASSSAAFSKSLNSDIMEVTVLEYTTELAPFAIPLTL